MRGIFGRGLRVGSAEIKLGLCMTLSRAKELSRKAVANQRLTAQQRRFAEAYVESGNRDLALRAAGYTPYRQTAQGLLAKPQVIAEVRRQEELRLNLECLPAAINLLQRALTDDTFPANSRVAAAKIVMDRTIGKEDAAAGKEPHEMTAEELQRAIEQLEREAGNRAKVINPDASKDDVFE